MGSSENSSTLPPEIAHQQSPNELRDELRITTLSLSGKKNFIPWGHSIRRVLQAKGLLAHLTNDPPDPTPPAWLKNDGRVQTWILNSLEGEPYEMVMYLPTAKGMWDELHSLYSGKDSLQSLFDIISDLQALDTGGPNITSVVARVKSLSEAWLQHQPPTSDLATQRAQREAVCIAMLMACVPPHLLSIRAQVLASTPTPSLSAVCSMLLKVSQPPEAPAPPSPALLQNTPAPSFPPPSSRGGRSAYRGRGRGGRGRPKCSFCGRDGHYESTCFRKTGNPPPPPRPTAAVIEDSSSASRADLEALRLQFQQLQGMLTPPASVASVSSPDLFTALLIRAIGQKLELTNRKNLKLLKLSKPSDSFGGVDAADISSLIYLWNPFSIMTCLGSCTSPIDNLMVVLAIYGACSRIAPLAAFGWVMATHFSLYPAILLIPVLLLLGYGPDAPPSKLFKEKSPHTTGNSVRILSWRPILHFLVWAAIWFCYVLLLSIISLKGYDGLYEMLKKTHGFILAVEDLSPNIGVMWYFFAEVFEFFRVFFLIVFHVNILFMISPLAIRLMHRPCFLAFVYIAISSMLKSYPSVGDAALYLSLLGLFANELAEMKLSFFLFCGYIGVSLLSPVMHNLWIWRGTGNANFYFATGLAYTSLQTVLVVESVSAMLNHDRMLRKELKKA